MNIYTPENKSTLRALVMSVQASTMAQEIVALGLRESARQMKEQGMLDFEIKNYIENELPNDADFVECVQLAMKSQSQVSKICAYVIDNMKAEIN